MTTTPRASSRLAAALAAAVFFSVGAVGLAACTPERAPGVAATSSAPAASIAPGSPAVPTSARAPAAAAAASAAPMGAPAASGARASSVDTIPTKNGPLAIRPVHHGTVVLEWNGKVMGVDPWSKAPLDGLPPADIVFVTDIHPDHFDQAAIDKVKKPAAVLVVPPVVAEKLAGAPAGTVVTLKNGESKEVQGVGVLAVPMYNRVRGPEPGKLYHDKGRGNGYVLTLGDVRVYLSGDTECTDEMRALRDIHVAFVCMNLPYTMPPSEAAECIRAFRPKIVYPYHYRGSDPTELERALASEKGIEVRVRSWY